MTTIDRITQILKQTNGVDDYKVLAREVGSYELFFVHGKLETVRKSISEDHIATVYCDHDGKRGNSSFNVYVCFDDDDIAKKAKEAVKKAKKIFDEPYVLADGGKYEREIPSNLSDIDERTIAERIAGAIQRANKFANCDINALEVFVTTSKTRVVNSKGTDKTQYKRSISIEAIPTCNGKDESVELFENYVLADLDENALTEEITMRLKDAQARLLAQKPASKLSCPIVLNAEEIKTLMEELVSDRSYAQEYGRSNLYSVGDALQSIIKGDKLTLTMRGRIEGSPASSYFDADGSDLTDVCVIKDGVVVANFGSDRFAQYVGKPTTGALSCIQVDAGAAPTGQLLATPHLELVYLSGLQVDLYNDYIGGEIRLAYYFDGKTRTPVTGIAMSGKLSDALGTMRLSKETTVRGSYFGPAKLMLDGINIY